MECPRCRTENPADHRFCSACGQKLARACPDCQFENSLAAGFCGGCGHALGAQTPKIAEPVSEGERRPVTVLFADLVGFTELSSRLDAEDLKAHVDSFYARTDRVIADYGGTVDKHIGDAVMALFGAPVAHGDDSERAVRAALDIHARLAKAGPSGPAQSVHIGIAAGEVVAGGFARGYTVLGESVNLASRLVGLAGAGETVISDALRQALGSRLIATPLPARALKGIEGLVRAWRVTGLAPASRDATPFVGRVHDRHLLVGMITATKASGRGRVVVLRGEAGIGKSRLLDETVAEAARAGFAVHRAFVLDFGAGRGQDAVPALALSLLGLGADSDRPARAAAIEAALARGLVEADEQALLEEILDLPSSGERWLIYAAMDNATRLARKQGLLAALARRTAKQGPLLIAIEDLHWAEPAMLGSVAALAEATAHDPILLLATTRPEGDPLDQAWQARLAEAEINRLDLAPLRPADSAALAASLMTSGDARIAACIARAQGNPLFLEQLLRHTATGPADSVPVSLQSVVLGSVAALAEATAHDPILLLATTRPEGDPLDQAWQARLAEAEINRLDLAPLRPADSAALAASLMTSGDARIAACIARAQGNPLFLEQLLRHTATGPADSVPVSLQSVVLGRLDRLPPEEKALLQAASVLGQRFAPELLAHLLERRQVEVTGLIEAHLLKPDAAGLVFAHALIRDGVYGSLLKARRRALHRKAADWFHGRDAGLEAEHLDRAEDPGAAVAYLVAAREASAQFQLSRAEALARRGGALGSDPAIKGALAALQGEAAQGLGETLSALQAFGLASASLPSGAERLAAMLGQANALSVLDRLEEALALLDQAQAEAQRLKLPVLLARIHGLRGNIVFPRGEVARCLAEHSRALELAIEARAPEEEARAHGGLGDAYYMSGDMASSIRHYERCVRVAAAQGYRRIEVANRSMYSLGAMFDLDFPGALGEAEAAVKLAIQVGHRRAEMIAEHMRYWNFIEMGKLEGARKAALRAIAISRQLNARRFEAEGLMFLGEALATAGDPEGVLRLREANVIARETPSYMLPSGLGLLAMLTPDPDEREAALQEGEALLAEGTVWHNRVFFNRYAIEAAWRSGNAARMLRYAEALGQVTREPTRYLDFLVRRAHALAAHLDDHGDRAVLAALRDEAVSRHWQAVLPDLETTLARA